ncbi:hypothetical protein STVA_12430 [Allostella vacuolata]|nr:hypothetical protein STVA_12430 [Stella vacuolata]
MNRRRAQKRIGLVPSDHAEDADLIVGAGIDSAAEATLRRRDVMAGILGAALVGRPAAAQPSGGKRTADVAREIFALNVRNSLGLAAGTFDVFPAAGLEDAGYHATLRTGPLFAWTAQGTEGRVLVNGFAGAGPGAGIAFEGFNGGPAGRGGLSALMRAVRLLDPRRRLPTQQIVDRVAFCLNRADRAEFLFDADVVRGSGFEPPPAIAGPSIRVRSGRVLLTYFTLVPGPTGAFEFGKVTVGVAAGYDVGVAREEVGW